MRRKTRLIALVTILLSLTLAESLRSQIRARVELVVVPVSVRDASGRLVTGLTKDDFIVTEDGVRQNIANFSLEPAPLSAAIIIDDGMGANALKRVAPLIDVLTSGFSPNDEMIAFRYDHFVWKLSDFTTDHSVIQKSFSDLAKIAETRPPEGEPGEPLTAAPAWLRSIAGTITLGSIGAPKPIPSGADRPKQVKTSRVLHNAVYEAANALKVRPESFRKMILLISDGQVAGSGNTQPIEKNVDLLLQQRIQVYSVATDYALREGGLGILSVYGKATGGDVYGGGSTRDMESAFLKITEQARNQYVLSYVSTNEPKGLQGVRREINVKTRNSDQTVTHRKSYIQIPAR